MKGTGVKSERNGLELFLPHPSLRLTTLGSWHPSFLVYFLFILD